MGSRAEPLARGTAGRMLRIVITSLAIFSPRITPGAMAQARPIPNGRLTSGVLSFDGHATVGDFTGTTRTISGQVTGASGLSSVRGWVEAPVQSLKTGNGKRDKDLNKSMESSKYP